MKVTNPSWNVYNLRQPKEDWSPNPGRLIVRQMLTLSSLEVNFDYRIKPTPYHGANAYKSIARIRDWIGEPDFGGSVECIRGEADATGAGNFVVRRLAYIEDLLALRRLWSKHATPFVDWVKIVLDPEEGIDMESRLMIVGLAPIK